jgi:hypothetical protein
LSAANRCHWPNPAVSFAVLRSWHCMHNAWGLPTSQNRAVSPRCAFT